VDFHPPVGGLGIPVPPDGNDGTGSAASAYVQPAFPIRARQSYAVILQPLADGISTHQGKHGIIFLGTKAVRMTFHNENRIRIFHHQPRKLKHAQPGGIFHHRLVVFKKKIRSQPAVPAVLAQGGLGHELLPSGKWESS